MDKACPKLKLWQIMLFYLLGLSFIGYGLIYKNLFVSIFGGIITILTSAVLLCK